MTGPFSILCSWCGTRVDPVVAPIHPSCDVERELWQSQGYPYQTRFLWVWQEMPRRRRRPQKAPETFPAAVMQGGGDSVVQRAAGKGALPRSGTRRRAVFDVVQMRGSVGVTFAEVEAITGINYSNCGPRMRELCGAQGLPVLVRNSGRTRTAPSGAEQVVWVAIS